MSSNTSVWEQLPPLRKLVEKYGLAADKSLGQHFLFDGNITDKIVRAANLPKGAVVLEIGPGPGGLTRSLLASEIASVIAVEKDARCVRALTESLLPISGDRLRLVNEDALRVEFETLVPHGTHIVANLPYNVGTELLLRFLKTPTHFGSLTLMFQREVAERIAATPGTKSYGRLAIFCQWLCEVVSQFDLPPSVFVPPPSVTSSVITLIPRKAPLYPATRAVLERLTQQLFSQRRKMLRSSLRGLVSDPIALLNACSVNPTARPETLPIEIFCRLAKAIEGS